MHRAWRCDAEVQRQAQEEGCVVAAGSEQRVTLWSRILGRAALAVPLIPCTRVWAVQGTPAVAAARATDSQLDLVHAYGCPAATDCRGHTAYCFACSSVQTADWRISWTRTVFKSWTLTRFNCKVKFDDLEISLNFLTSVTFKNYAELFNMRSSSSFYIATLIHECVFVCVWVCVCRGACERICLGVRACMRMWACVRA